MMVEHSTKKVQDVLGQKLVMLLESCKNIRRIESDRWQQWQGTKMVCEKRASFRAREKMWLCSKKSKYGNKGTIYFRIAYKHHCGIYHFVISDVNFFRISNILSTICPTHCIVQKADSLLYIWFPFCIIVYILFNLVN